MAKTTIIELENRIETPVDTTTGIIKYDTDNAYPQRMQLYASASGTAQACVKIYAKYIRGMGFANQSFYSAIINSKRWTNDKLLKAISKDFALFQGFALHFNYNALLEISEINYVPFENVRIAEPDDTGYSGKLKLHPDWARKKQIGRRRANIDEKSIKTVHVFNPDKEVLLKQIEEAGGIENYKGQVFYYNSESENYPFSTIDSFFEDCETDAELKYYKNRTVTTSFMDATVVVRNKFATDDERTSFVAGLKKFQGSRNSSKTILIEKDTPEEVFELKPFTGNVDDKKLSYTEESTRINIVRNFNIPPILVGISPQGALGDKNDREGAKIIYSEQTEDERILMESVFANIFKYWHRKEDNPENNFSIQPITGTITNVDPKLLDDMTQNERRVNILKLKPNEDQSSAKKMLAETLGVGGTQAYTSIIVDPVMTPQQKVNNLIILFGLTEEDAKKAVDLKSNVN